MRAHEAVVVAPGGPVGPQEDTPLHLLHLRQCAWPLVSIEEG